METNEPVGSPLDPSPVVEPPKTVETPEEPLYQGITGEVKSVDDLKEYARNLEKKLLDTKRIEEPKVTMAQPVAIEQYKAPEGETFEDLIFANPNKAKEVLRKEIFSELKTMQSAEEAKKSFWNEFYTKNSDLKPLDRIVQSVVKDRWADLEHLPIQKAKEVIAKETRELIGLVRAPENRTETELDSKGAVMFGSSGSEVPRTGAGPAKPLNFTEQVAAFKRRGKK